MTDMSYLFARTKPIRWIQGNIKTPPFSKAARVKAGVLLRMLQAGVLLSLPESRPLPIIGPRCHELRISDAKRQWRIIYPVEKDAIVILEVFAKKSRQLSSGIISVCKKRLEAYET